MVHFMERTKCCEEPFDSSVFVHVPRGISLGPRRPRSLLAFHGEEHSSRCIVFMAFSYPIRPMLA